MSRVLLHGTFGKWKLLWVGVATCTMLICASASHAGMLASTANALDYDSTTWKGSVPVPSVGASVDFAVFGPGQFADFLAENPGIVGADPSEPGKLTYAYQVVDVASPGLINVVSVGDREGHGAGTYPPGVVQTGSVGENAPPFIMSDGGSAWGWQFLIDPINGGEESSLLYFVSDKLPEWDNVALATMTGASGPTPVPVGGPVPSISSVVIPEPASIVLLVIGCGGVLVTGRRRIA